MSRQSEYESIRNHNSNFRNQFMSNTNASHDQLDNLNDEFNFQDYEMTHLSNQQYPYETDSKSANPFKEKTLPLPPPPPVNGPLNGAVSSPANGSVNGAVNPFHTPFESPLDRTQPYYNDESDNKEEPFYNADPFTDAKDKEIHLNPNELDEQALLKHNEKQRLRQLRSKPRFHYTRLPYFGIIVTAIQVVVFIVELIKMAQLTGSAFQTKPYFNPMLGPSTYLLINMGARYTPCMNAITDITDDLTVLYPCPNSTNIDTDVCSLNQLCGLSGIPSSHNGYEPNQWYRVITPIFLHAGFLHIIFNLLLQVTMGFSVERYIGSIKYAIIYMLSGISGFLLGANFTPNGIASTGASGSLFGIVCTNIVLFVYAGKKNPNMYGTKKFGLFLCIMIGEIVVSFVLGLLPGLDNFSHIGGFAMGLLSSIVLLQDPHWVYNNGIIAYQSHLSTMEVFKNNWNPLYNGKYKIKSRFFIWCGVRGLAVVMIILYYVLLIENFFGKSEVDKNNDCSWCKYISCLPVNGWCDNGYVDIQTTAESESTPTQSHTSDNSQQTLPSSVENPNTRKRRDLRIFAEDVFGII